MKTTARIAFVLSTIVFFVSPIYGDSADIPLYAILPEKILSSVEGRFTSELLAPSDLKPLRNCLIKWASRCSLEPTDTKVVKFLNSTQPEYEIKQAIPIFENHLQPLLSANGGMLWFISWTRGLVDYSGSLPTDANSLRQMHQATTTIYRDQQSRLIQLWKSLPRLSTGEQYVELPVEIYVAGGYVSAHTWSGEQVSAHIDGQMVRGAAKGIIKTGEDERAKALSEIEDIIDSLPEITKQLLVLETRITAFDQALENTTIHEAAKSGELEVLNGHLQKGVSKDEKDKYGNTPLMWTAIAGKLSVAKFLLDEGANVNEANRNGDTPLMGASFYGHDEIVNILQEHGADVNTTNVKGVTPLHAAVYGGHMEIVKFLVDKGANVNARDRDGNKPLSRAKKPAMIEFLKQHGAKE